MSYEILLIYTAQNLLYTRNVLRGRKWVSRSRFLFAAWQIAKRAKIRQVSIHLEDGTRVRESS